MSDKDGTVDGQEGWTDEQLAPLRAAEEEEVRLHGPIGIASRRNGQGHNLVSQIAKRTKERIAEAKDAGEPPA